MNQQSSRSMPYAPWDKVWPYGPLSDQNKGLGLLQYRMLYHNYGDFPQFQMGVTVMWSIEDLRYWFWKLVRVYFLLLLLLSKGLRLSKINVKCSVKRYLETSFVDSTDAGPTQNKTTHFTLHLQKSLTHAVISWW